MMREVNLLASSNLERDEVPLDSVLDFMRKP